MLTKKTKNQTASHRFTALAAMAVMSVVPLTIATTAQAAAPASDLVKIAIDSDDLDSAEGVFEVYAAFQAKAEAACQRTSTRALTDRKFERICEADLVDDFVVDLNDPNVFEVHYNGTVTIE